MPDDDLPPAPSESADDAAKAETIRITLPAKPDQPTLKRETVRINLPGKPASTVPPAGVAPKKETTKIPAGLEDACAAVLRAKALCAGAAPAAFPAWRSSASFQAHKRNQSSAETTFIGRPPHHSSEAHACSREPATRTDDAIGGAKEGDRSDHAPARGIESRHAEGDNQDAADAATGEPARSDGIHLGFRACHGRLYFACYRDRI